MHNKKVVLGAVGAAIALLVAVAVSQHSSVPPAPAPAPLSPTAVAPARPVTQFTPAKPGAEALEQVRVRVRARLQQLQAMTPEQWNADVEQKRQEGRVRPGNETLDEARTRVAARLQQFEQMTTEQWNADVEQKRQEGRERWNNLPPEKKAEITQRLQERRNQQQQAPVQPVPNP